MSSSSYKKHRINQAVLIKKDDATRKNAQDNTILIFLVCCSTLWQQLFPKQFL